MIKQEVTIVNTTGLHLRPAGIFCNVASRYKSKITFEHENFSANAKSILSVLGACIKKGDSIVLTCEGTDEEEAMAAMLNAIEDGLGE